MRGGGKSLVDLVETARDRALTGKAIEHWHIEARQWGVRDANRAWSAAGFVADEVCLLCLGGQFGWARNVAFPYDLYVSEELWEDLAALDECPAWVAFSEVVEMAERIDALLAALESDRRTAPLARDCRDNVDLLLVLADWCQDNDRPRAAAEARHLHALACSLRR
jgi:hypothetical protein